VTQSEIYRVLVIISCDTFTFKGANFVTYLRCSIGKWSIDLNSPEAKAIVEKINNEDVKVFQKQAGFISYRLMRASAEVTVAVAEWQSEELGKVGLKIIETG
jgi:hypothetical protein